MHVKLSLQAQLEIQAGPAGQGPTREAMGTPEVDRVDTSGCPSWGEATVFSSSEPTESLWWPQELAGQAGSAWISSWACRAGLPTGRSENLGFRV